MVEDVFLLVRCDAKTERSQKYQACTIVEEKIKKVKGIEKTFFTGNQEADITAFAKWHEADIQKYVQEIKEITGVKEVEAKVLVPL